MSGFFEQHPEFTSAGTEARKAQFQETKRLRALQRIADEKKAYEELGYDEAPSQTTKKTMSEKKFAQIYFKPVSEQCKYCNKVKSDVILGVCPECTPPIKKIQTFFQGEQLKAVSISYNET